MVDTGREAGDCNDGRKTKAMQENEKVAWGGKGETNRGTKARRPADKITKQTRRNLMARERTGWTEVMWRRGAFFFSFAKMKDMAEVLVRKVFAPDRSVEGAEGVCTAVTAMT